MTRTEAETAGGPFECAGEVCQQNVHFSVCCKLKSGSWHFHKSNKDELDLSRRKMIMLIYKVLQSRLLHSGEKKTRWLERLPEFASFLEAQLISVAPSLQDYQDQKSIPARLKSIFHRLVILRYETKRKRENGEHRYWVLALLNQLETQRCVPRGYTGRRTRSRFVMETTSALVLKLSRLDRFLQRHIIEFL